MKEEDFSLKLHIDNFIKRKRLALHIIFAVIVLATVYNIFIERTYKAETTIIPIEASKGSFLDAFSGQGLFQALNGVFSNTTTSANKLLNILKSRTLTENVINSLNLLPMIYDSDWDKENGKWKDPENIPLMENAVENLQRKIMTIRNTEEGIISITAIFKDQELAANIANQYVYELQKFIDKASFSFGKKQSVFLKQQIEKTQQDLTTAELTLKEFQEKNKFISITAQGEMTVKTIANLKAEILSREYKLGLLSQNSDLNTSGAKGLMNEKRELEKQVKKLEHGDLSTESKAIKPLTGGIITVKDYPAIEMEYVRLKRDFLIFEKVFELLNTQYELAKIEESRYSLSFEVIDKAIVPLKKYRPDIIINYAIALFGSLLISILVTTILDRPERKKCGD